LEKYVEFNCWISKYISPLTGFQEYISPDVPQVAGFPLLPITVAFFCTCLSLYHWSVFSRITLPVFSRITLPVVWWPKSPKHEAVLLQCLPRQPVRLHVADSIVDHVVQSAGLCILEWDIKSMPMNLNHLEIYRRLFAKGSRIKVDVNKTLTLLGHL